MSMSLMLVCIDTRRRMQGIFGERERPNMSEEFSTSSDHAPHVQTSESDGLQVSRRL